MGMTTSAPIPMDPMKIPQLATSNAGQSLDKLADALMKAKRNQLLSAQLPGTTPQSLGLGSAAPVSTPVSPIANTDPLAAMFA